MTFGDLLATVAVTLLVLAAFGASIGVFFGALILAVRLVGGV